MSETHDFNREQEELAKGGNCRKQGHGSYGGNVCPKCCVHSAQARLGPTWRVECSDCGTTLQWITVPMLFDLRAQLEAFRAELEAVAATVSQVEDPKIERGDRSLHDWLAQILQVLVMDRGNDAIERGILRQQLEACQREKAAAVDANVKIGRQLLEHSELVNSRGEQIITLLALLREACDILTLVHLQIPDRATREAATSIRFCCAALASQPAVTENAETPERERIIAFLNRMAEDPKWRGLADTDEIRHFVGHAEDYIRGGSFDEAYREQNAEGGKV